MEGIRSKLVLTKRLLASGFMPDNANLSHFMQRLPGPTPTAWRGCPSLGDRCS
jgi:hypothetical protein